MRQIGSLATESESNRFFDYLVSRKIHSRVERADSEWEIWVYDEDHLGEAREALQRFRDNPEAAEFQEAAKQAVRIRKEQERKTAEAIRNYKKNQRPVQTWGPPRLSQLPITMFLIFTSVMVTLVMSIEDSSFTGIANKLSINSFAPSGENYIRYEPGLADIRRGEVWRLITPIFKHFGPLHLVMNMWITYQFGLLLEPFLKSWRFLILVLFIGVVSNVSQYLLAGPTFGGMSGVDFGLFGFLWMKGLFEPHRGLGLRQDFVYFMLGFMVLCFTGIFGHIANGAHVMGLVSGCIAALIRPAWLNLRRKFRQQ